MNVHDKHQYYFERYLRNEMPKDEQMAFEEKLTEDASLRMALEYYKLNRQKLLEQLIEEHKLTKRDNRLNKLIFLLISLTGIGLTFNYFIYRSQNISSIQNEKSKNVLIRYIPFLNWEKRIEKKNITSKFIHLDSNTFQNDTIAEAIDTLVPSTDRNERLLSDQFIADTFINIWEKSFFDQWIIQNELLASSTSDSIEPKIMSVNPKENTSKLLVEYWKSPVSYRGYLFVENKLVIYGIPFSTILYVYKDRNIYVMVLPTGSFQLTEQTNFIPF
jgi:hypothetical protein